MLIYKHIVLKDINIVDQPKYTNSLICLQILNVNEHSLLMQTGCCVLLRYLLALLRLIVSRFLRNSV